MRGTIPFVVTIAMSTPAYANENVVNGDFSDDMNGWWATDNVTPVVRNGQLCTDIPGGTQNPWDVIVGQNDLTLTEGEGYAFTFTASANAPSVVRAVVQEGQDPWTTFGSVVPTVTAEADTYEVTFEAGASMDNVQVVFQVGGAAEPWSLCLQQVSLIGGAEIEAYAPDTGPAVRVNQVGYLPDGPKRATMVSDAKEALGWALMRGGKVVLEGQTAPQGVDPSSGLGTHLIDFSEYAEASDDFTLAVGERESHPFRIADDVFAPLLGDALAYYYPNRSGIEVDGAIAGEAYARPAGHIGIAPNQGDTAVPCQAPESSQAAYGEPWTCDYTLDVTGGWYDAGDHGKYVVNGGISVAQLMTAYERAPDRFADGDMAIPEMGNGVPDILDEARWQLEFMLKMQVPEGQPLAGMVHHKIHDNEWTGLPLMPHLSDKLRELHRPSTAATLNLAAVAAQGARLFAEYDAAFADRLLDAALTAYAAAEAAPDLFATPEDGQSGGGPYDDDTVSDEFFWAAAELFMTTGDAQWLTAMETHQPPMDVLFGDAAFDWKNTGALSYISVALRAEGLPDDQRAAMREGVMTAADAYVAAQEGEHFGQIYAPEGYDYDWGSNHLHLQNALVVAAAYDLTGEDRYRDAVVEAMDYIFGRNALNISYVTGYGTHYAKNQHSRWLANQLNPDLPNPPKGALAGGPNSSIQDPVAQRLLKGCAAQFCYVDDIDSWSTNEITINWNAALVQIAAILAEY